jgi:hypothetical protein
VTEGAPPVKNVIYGRETDELHSKILTRAWRPFEKASFSDSMVMSSMPKPGQIFSPLSSLQPAPSQSNIPSPTVSFRISARFIIHGMLKPRTLRRSVPVYGVAEQGIEVVSSEGSGARTPPLGRKMGPHSVMLVGDRPEGVNTRFPSRCWVLP